MLMKKGFQLIRPSSISMRAFRPLQMRMASHGSAHDHHDDHHHHEAGSEPGGYFLGEPTSKRAWYWWEPMWYFGYYGSFVTFVIFSLYSPQKSPTELAKEEAHRRLLSRGESLGWPLPPNYAITSAKDTPSP
ncbi:hypothetical protein HDU97_002570 [Phlyctochytrium planicorne]|nr:hypothetical protein HDU97_002570 [Phlyctochytrium planicorne]